MLSGLTLKAKILLLSSLIVVGLSTLGLTAYLQIHSFNTVVHDTAIHSKRRSEILVEIQSAAINFKTQVQEWKNILIRGNNADQFTRYVDGFITAESVVQKHLAAAMALQQQEGIAVDALEQLQKEHAKLGKNYREALGSFNQENPEAGKIVDKLVSGMDREASRQMQELADKTTGEFDQFLIESDIKTGKIYSHTVRLLLIICISASVIIITVMVFIFRDMFKACRCSVTGSRRLSQCGYSIEARRPAFAARQRGKYAQTIG